MLVAARSSYDLACCRRATAMLSRKHSSASFGLQPGDKIRRSPINRYNSASAHVSLVRCAATRASLIVSLDSYSRPCCAYAVANMPRKIGVNRVELVDEYMAKAAFRVRAASAPRPFTDSSQPCRNKPNDFQKNKPC